MNEAEARGKAEKVAVSRVNMDGSMGKEMYPYLVNAIATALLEAVREERTRATVLAQDMRKVVFDYFNGKVPDLVGKVLEKKLEGIRGGSSDG